MSTNLNPPNRNPKSTLSRMAEGLPLVFFEAMACGTPVITRSGGTPEIVMHEETGLLVEGSEPDKVASAMRRLLAHRDERDRMGQRGYEIARGYDWRAVASSYVEVYQDLLATKQGP